MSELKEGLSTSRVLEIAEAITLIGENTSLDGTVMYRVGRLGDRVKSVTNSFNRTRDKKLKEARGKHEAINKKIATTTDEVEKKTLQEELKEVNSNFEDEMRNVLDEPVNDITLMELNMSDFIAKDNIVGADNVILTRKGQSLVPLKFFTLMGDLVKDDKHLIKD